MPVPMYTRVEIDQRLREIDSRITNVADVAHKRIDGEARYCSKLDQRVHLLEEAISNGLFRQEYPVAPVETRSCLDDKDIRPLARTFVAMLGEANRDQLRIDLSGDGGKKLPGQAVRALKAALAR